MKGKRKPAKKVKWFKTTFGSLLNGTIFAAFPNAETRMRKIDARTSTGTDGLMKMPWEIGDPVWVPMHVKSDFKE
jgi:hypothetical protein